MIDDDFKSLRDALNEAMSGYWYNYEVRVDKYLKIKSTVYDNENIRVFVLLFDHEYEIWNKLEDGGSFSFEAVVENAESCINHIKGKVMEYCK